MGQKMTQCIFNIQKKSKQLPFGARRTREFCKLEIFRIEFPNTKNRLLWKEPTNAVNPAVCL